MATADGIHVELEVSDVDGCPAATVSERADVASVTTSRRQTGDGERVVGEFTADSDADVGDSAEAVLSDTDSTVYRFASDTDCPCGRLPDHGCPVRNVRAEDGTVVLTFIVADVAALRTVVADLRDCCGSVRVRRLTRSTAEDGETLVVVDRSAFTDRQYEALQTAHDRGYFERPRETSAADVADELGISAATFGQHLAVAQRKLLDQLVET
ncbi:hypothetical protein SAMN04487949_2621 [Halogranum gelatinilyticum]|uniref:HTH bat-type domain-containing protein n=1 Tax=Halogranum gelatinilyticum TaxID=660521 RepID=A0A1G9W6E4_9EURY|nr:helix-turn-helix domain-containing protein [Halogranum gelatinilyticum]SDM79635.1 hypothetical protein SAMN04487949_2621 [Halogranum gelatinilyticum]